MMLATPSRSRRWETTWTELHLALNAKDPPDSEYVADLIQDLCDVLNAYEQVQQVWPRLHRESNYKIYIIMRLLRSTYLRQDWIKFLASRYERQIKDNPQIPCLSEHESKSTELPRTQRSPTISNSEQRFDSQSSASARTLTRSRLQNRINPLLRQLIP